MKTVKNLALVDDDHVYTFLTSRAIQASNLVEEIKIYSNGKEVLNFIKENSNKPDLLPEIILLDLSMPIMDGWQFIEEYLLLKPTIEKKIMIYICSSSISPDDVVKAKNIIDVSEYIIKPLTKQKFIELMEKHLAF